ncbi:MAG: hypothetical protein OSA45_00675 [Halioglobus sp.]|nr:hypothetical protein [Halioglobus sp.]
MAQTENDRFFFIHALKTGGTSFTNMLGTSFEDSRQYPGACLGPDADFVMRMEAYMYLPTFSANLNALAEPLKTVRAYALYAVRNLLNHNYRVLAILRNPIDQTLSYLNHARKHHTEQSIIWSIKKCKIFGATPVPPPLPTMRWPCVCTHHDCLGQMKTW